MSVCVCLFSTEDKFTQDMWAQSLVNFPPDVLYVIGQLAAFGKLKPFRIAIEIADLSELPDVPLVLLEPDNGHTFQGTTSLRDFQHPEHVIYLFGDDNTRRPSLDTFNRRKPDSMVYIPTHADHQLFAATAYAITMWDRANG